MKANEIRIGNFIQMVFDGYLPKIKCCSTHAINDILLADQENTEPFYLQPIPLTEDWIKRAGFVKINHIHEGELYLIEKIKLRIFLNGRCELRGAWIPQSIKFVHQLQNLYFALTGEELVFSGTGGPDL